MKKLIIILISTLVANFTFAQQDVQFTQFVFNKLAYNAGYAGSKDALSTNAIYRNQWTGIDGAPTSVRINAHTPFFHNRCGIGISYTNDQIGILNSNAIDVNYAYRIPIGNELTLALGANVNFEFLRADWTKADLVDSDDDLIPLENTKKTSPNFGMGAYLQHENYYVGIAMPKMLRNSLYREDTDISRSLRNFKSVYLMGGAVFTVTDFIQFKPSALVSMNPNAPIDLDVNAMFLFLNKLWVGASYRMGDSVDALVAYQFSDQVLAGLAFDFTTSELNDFTTGSYELMLQYDFIYNQKAVNNIRFF